MLKPAPAPERATWIATLAKAPLSQLEAQIAPLDDLPPYAFLRQPEIGLTMVRGRVEGTGAPFNLGEMTITRCVVQLTHGENAIAGFGYVAGRSRRHAELAAFCDALLQHPDWQAVIQAQVIEPLQQFAAKQRATQAAEVEATRVNFFTMLRGEG